MNKYSERLTSKEQRGERERNRYTHSHAYTDITHWQPNKSQEFLNQLELKVLLGLHRRSTMYYVGLLVAYRN